MRNNNFLIVIVGPTAVGKTAICVELAKELGCPVLSADSRQFFKEMEIGTARPGKEEMKVVRHFFVDFLHVNEEMSAGKFEEIALQTLNGVFQRHQTAILTGGSGLYIKAVCEGMSEMPSAPMKYREDLMEELRSKGLPDLLDELKQKDPEYYEYVDKSNQQRVVRALEMIRFTKKPFSSFRNRQSLSRDFSIIKIGLELERKQLYERIDKRVDEMLEKGLLQEVEKLYPLKHLNSLQTVGYKEFFDYMDNHYDLKEAIRLVKRNTRRYAKRQLTWFKKDDEIRWFNPNQFNEILTFIRRSATGR